MLRIHFGGIGKPIGRVGEEEVACERLSQKRRISLICHVTDGARVNGSSTDRVLEGDAGVARPAGKCALILFWEICALLVRSGFAVVSHVGKEKRRIASKSVRILIETPAHLTDSACHCFRQSR